VKNIINAINNAKKIITDLMQGIKQCGQKLKELFSKQTGKEK
jgi:hypothetical protein